MSTAPADVEVTVVDYVVQSYAAAVAEGWRANVWYSALGVRCSGLLDGSLNPKAAYYAYQFTAQKLGQAVFLKQLGGNGQVMAYEYEIPGKDLWVMWSMDGQAHSVNLPQVPQVVNRIGEDGQATLEASSQVISIDSSPWFIEFNL